MKASSKGHKDIVRVLLEHGADVNVTSTEVNTLLPLPHLSKPSHLENKQYIGRSMYYTVYNRYRLFCTNTAEQITNYGCRIAIIYVIAAATKCSIATIGCISMEYFWVHVWSGHVIGFIAS